ncbi:MAG TPA: hypothetical protein PKD64_02450 [Pirellulaceae bacterium]|nr:hypothetical protein [Pirellulaceae bacterium]HMO91029.1 hypothetical protein [Pirellulaceae bacterium]HMP68144.1 hypothetical protein [Pirellulaceae bacterium]
MSPSKTLYHYLVRPYSIRIDVVKCIYFIAATSISMMLSVASSQDSPDSPSDWWKGNLHTHTLWSDGDDFPEMVTDWYVRHGYHFLVLSDHNILSVGNKWMKDTEIVRRGGRRALDKYIERFGRDWVEQRMDEAGESETRLKPLDEFRTLFETPGKFLMMPGEEITDSVGRLPVHMNATNLPELIRPMGGATVREAMVNNLKAVEEVAERTGRKVLVHLNHPNFGWALTPEDLAYVAEEQFFEIYNGHPAVNHLGDEFRPGLELMWDIANTLRIDQFKSRPLFGLATDDSHNYHGRASNPSSPGRGWILVRATHLTPETLLNAMARGDFYASSGVSLRHLDFNEDSRTIEMEIEGQTGVEYVTQFVGTPADYDRSWPPPVDKQGNRLSVKERYCPKIGSVLGTLEGTRITFQVPENALYVRAIVTSSRSHPNPSFENQFEQAWTQPFGWKRN